MALAFVINISYAMVAIVITLIAMRVGFHVLDRALKFDTSEELRKGNVAVGLVAGGLLIGLGMAIGLVIGMAVN